MWAPEPTRLLQTAVEPVQPELWQADQEGPPAPTDPLAELSDTFPGASLDASWLAYNGSGVTSATVSGGAATVVANQGGLTGAFWYDALLGGLIYKLVTGDFDVVETLAVQNSAGSGLPPVDNFRLCGIAAHDPDRSGPLNYVHVALGATADATLMCEWKTTVDSESDSGVIATGQYGSIPAPTGAGQIRLRRVGQVFTAYYRASSSDAWTLVETMDRTTAPLPDTLQIGMMVYSNLLAHDIRGVVQDITFSTP